MHNKSDRAKQFLPFDALKGFREALEEAEIEQEEKRDLSEDFYNELEKEFNKIQIGIYIKINYYSYKNKKYLEVSGVVTNIDYKKKKLEIDKNVIINILDIVKIDIL